QPLCTSEAPKEVVKRRVRKIVATRSIESLDAAANRASDRCASRNGKQLSEATGIGVRSTGGGADDRVSTSHKSRLSRLAVGSGHARNASLQIAFGTPNIILGATTMTITNEVLESYLNCKLKGCLKLAGESASKSDYETKINAARQAS